MADIAAAPSTSWIRSPVNGIGYKSVHEDPISQNAYSQRTMWNGSPGAQLGSVGVISVPVCSYCGKVVARVGRDHVFPRNLYPRSKTGSTVQRLTVAACGECNASFSNDEAHFRNVLVMSGNTPNLPRRALWEGPIRRSFDQPDARKRIDDLLALTEPMDFDGVVHHIIHPAEDERVLRIVRKSIRGLGSVDISA